MNNQTVKTAATLAGYSKIASEITDMHRRITAFAKNTKEVRAFLNQQEKLLAVNENAKRLAALAAVAGAAFVCAAFAAQYIESHKLPASPNFKIKKP